MLAHIEAKLRLTTRWVETVTWKTVLSEDRPDITVEVDRRRWRCALLGKGLWQRGEEEDDSETGQ